MWDPRTSGSPPPIEYALPSAYRYDCEKATGMAMARSTPSIPVRLRRPQHYEAIPCATVRPLVPSSCRYDCRPVASMATKILGWSSHKRASRHSSACPGQAGRVPDNAQDTPRTRLWKEQDHHGYQGSCVGPSWRTSRLRLRREQDHQGTTGPQSTRTSNNNDLGDRRSK